MKRPAAMDALSQRDIVALRPGSDDVVVVGWLVTPCDRHAALDGGGDRDHRGAPSQARLRCPGDPVASSRFQFADPARAALMRGSADSADDPAEKVPQNPGRAAADGRRLGR